MALRAGDGVSIGTWGWVLTDTGADVTPPDKGRIWLGSVTTTTASINVTPPEDVDYDHCDLSLTVEGQGTDTLHTAFSGELASLSPDTWHLAVVTAVDSSGNRGLPSPAIRFKTKRAAGGTHNFTVEYRTDEAVSAAVSTDCDIMQDRHPVPLGLRGLWGELRVTMTEVDQDVEFIGYVLDGYVLARRAP